MTPCHRTITGSPPEYQITERLRGIALGSQNVPGCLLLCLPKPSGSMRLEAGGGRCPMPRIQEMSRGIPTCAAQKSRSEEHTSELQSRPHLVCRLLLEK